MIKLGFELWEKKEVAMEKKGKRTTVDAPRSLLASELIAKPEENRARNASYCVESVVKICHVGGSLEN